MGNMNEGIPNKLEINWFGPFPKQWILPTSKKYNSQEIHKQMFFVGILVTNCLVETKEIITMLNWAPFKPKCCWVTMSGENVWDLKTTGISEVTNSNFYYRLEPLEWSQYFDLTIHLMKVTIDNNHNF